MNQLQAKPSALRAYLEVVRFTLCLIVFVLALEGYWLATRRFDLLNLSALSAALTVACAIGFANAHNDIIDRETDLINSPQRPIPSGRAHVPTVKLLSSGLCALSIIFGYSAGCRMFLLAIFAIGTSALYNLWGRKVALLGNSIVALLCALTLAAGYCVAAAGEFPIIPFISSFLFILARELIGTVCDVAGDRVGGRMSLCMLLGPGAVLSISLILAVLAVLALCSALLFKQIVFPLGYMLCIICTSILPIAYAIRSIWRDRSADNIRRVTYRMRMVFILNFISFLWLVPAQA